MRKFLILLICLGNSFIYANDLIDSVHEQAKRTAYLSGVYSSTPKGHTPHLQLYSELINELDQKTLKEHPELYVYKILAWSRAGCPASYTWKEHLADLDFILEHADPDSIPYMWADLRKSKIKLTSLLDEKFASRNDLSQKERNRAVDEEVAVIFMKNGIPEGSTSRGAELRKEILENLDASNDLKSAFYLSWVQLWSSDPHVILGNAEICDLGYFRVSEEGKIHFQYVYVVEDSSGSMIPVLDNIAI